MLYLLSHFIVFLMHIYLTFHLIEHFIIIFFLLKFYAHFFKLLHNYPILGGLVP